MLRKYTNYNKHNHFIGVRIQKNKMSKSKYQEFNKAIVTKPANAKRQYSAKTILESMEASVSEQV